MTTKNYAHRSHVRLGALLIYTWLKYDITLVKCCMNHKATKRFSKFMRNERNGWWSKRYQRSDIRKWDTNLYMLVVKTLFHYFRPCLSDTLTDCLTLEWWWCIREWCSDACMITALTQDISMSPTGGSKIKKNSLDIIQSFLDIWLKCISRSFKSLYWTTLYIFFFLFCQTFWFSEVTVSLIVLVLV